MFCLMTGYGHSTPHTDAGIVFCIFFTTNTLHVLHVYMYTNMFQKVGERMNTFVCCLMSRVSKYIGVCSVSTINMVSVDFLTCLSTLCMGAVAFSHFEVWNFFHAFYYYFLTLSTINFGDFVALQKKEDLEKNAFCTWLLLLCTSSLGWVWVEHSWISWCCVSLL